MPLSNDARFGVQAMTEAVNALPVTPTQIRDLQLFKPVYLNTSHVDVEEHNGQLTLVQSKERGSQGDASEARQRKVRTFKIPHLPKNDVVLAEDVQNLRGFGTSQAQTVEATVNDKLADMKADIEFTREHLALGALKGLILDADGSTLYDLYSEFGMQREITAWALSTESTKVGGKIDQTVSALRKKLKGEMVSKWACLCGAEFMEKLKYHESIKALYERYRDGAAYREGSMNHIEFEHNGVQFIQYDGDFGDNKAKIAANEGIILPLGTRKVFAEYFAPADMSSAVNTKALAYYASREKMKHDKGWDLHAQSNALPLVLRPDLVETVTV